LLHLALDFTLNLSTTEIVGLDRLTNDVGHKGLLDAGLARQLVHQLLVSLDRDGRLGWEVDLGGDSDAVLFIVLNKRAHLSLIIVQLSHKLDHAERLHHLNKVGLALHLSLSIVKGLATVVFAAATAEHPFNSVHIVFGLRVDRSFNIDAGVTGAAVGRVVHVELVSHDFLAFESDASIDKCVANEVHADEEATEHSEGLTEAATQINGVGN
jgi:hypothetical protein